jgi:predicted dehydrogenase
MSELTGVASRSAAKAAAFKEEFGFKRAFASYETLLDDPKIEAVYVPLPISEHVGWCLEALACGKHVLCEKPLAAKASGVQTLIDAAQRYPNQRVAEGFMYRFHPRWIRAKEMIQAGVIGMPISLTMEFSFRNVDGGNIRNNALLSGGALNDAGCYLVSASRYLLDREPLRVVGGSQHDGSDQPDGVTSALIDFGSCSAMMVASLRSHKAQSVTVHGEKGSLRMSTAFDIAPDMASAIHVEFDKGAIDIPFDPFDQFRAQIEDFCGAIRDARAPLMSLSESLANAKVLEAIRRSVAERQWIEIPPEVVEASPAHLDT